MIEVVFAINATATQSEQGTVSTTSQRPVRVATVAIGDHRWPRRATKNARQSPVFGVSRIGDPVPEMDSCDVGVLLAIDVRS